MKIVKSFKNCSLIQEKEERLSELRRNIVKYSKGEFSNDGDIAINVNWGWINYIELKFKNSNNLTLEVWVADVKHQWAKLSKVSDMRFVKEYEDTILIDSLAIEANNYIGAYIKLGDTYGRTLTVADFDNKYVKSNFDKSTYTNFYKMLGGKWEYNAVKEDFERNGMLLIEEINKLNLVKEQKDAIIEYVKNETRNVINLSLGTTIKIDIPINELAEKDINYDYEKSIDELAEPIYNFIMEFKKNIEDKNKC